MQQIQQMQQMQQMQRMRITASGNDNPRERGVKAIAPWRAHSTPDPDAEPPAPNPQPDDVPPPAHAPVQEPPSSTEPPIKAGRQVR
jgi:hypothetical protein